MMLEEGVMHLRVHFLLIWQGTLPRNIPLRKIIKYFSTRFTTSTILLLYATG